MAWDYCECLTAGEGLTWSDDKGGSGPVTPGTKLRIGQNVSVAAGANLVVTIGTNDTDFVLVNSPAPIDLQKILQNSKILNRVRQTMTNTVPVIITPGICLGTRG